MTELGNKKYFTLLILFVVSFGFAINAAPAAAQLMVSHSIKHKTKQARVAPVPHGYWGASGIGVTVEEKSVSIQFDCAEAGIREVLTADKTGSFKVKGFYQPHSPGPTRLNDPPKDVPAWFEGKVTGKVMIIKITLVDSKDVIGEYTVELGKTGRMHRCL
ncbi:MAG: hypothetical protein ABJB40_00835 [Acidobacteriota bacterium]